MMQHARQIATVALVIATNFGTAQAKVTISASPTRNMSCTAGICAPTAQNAVLNVNDLKALLAAGNVTVTTTGAGVQASDIAVNADFGWSDASALTFDAYDSITIRHLVAVAGPGGLTLVTNDGGSNGTLAFHSVGRVAFQDLASQLTINGTSFELENSLPALARAVDANPGGAFALADNYDASGDGTYLASPITTSLSGTIEGLGNTISQISINTRGNRGVGGLLKEIAGGTLENLSLSQLSIAADSSKYGVGGMVGENSLGVLSGDHVQGDINVTGRNGNGFAGGLVGYNAGLITNSYAITQVAARSASAGGLAGGSSAYGSTISNSFAMGSVSGAEVGGLMAINGGAIRNSYARVAVRGAIGSQFSVGGLIGWNPGGVEYSYSAGRVRAKTSDFLGGLIGSQEGSADHTIWDTTTSGAQQGTGQSFQTGPVTTPGIVPLTSRELKSHLPEGFDPTIWAEDKQINSGFPYLIANPPPK